MKLINRDTDYAVRALGFISQHKDKIVTVSDMVKALRMPRPFLRKILQALNRRKLLRSTKGRGGGFILERPADKILLADIIRIFQGPLENDTCLFKKRLCPNRDRCILRRKISGLEKRISLELESITLKSLLH